MTSSHCTPRFSPARGSSLISVLLGLPAVFLSISLCLGCSTVHLNPRVTSISDYSREKDIKTYVISVDSRMDEEAYQLWAQEHIEQHQLDLNNPDYPEIPIYEVHYHFVLGESRFRTRRVAFLTWGRSNEDQAKLEHLFTYIGSRVPMQNWILR